MNDLLYCPLQTKGMLCFSHHSFTFYLNCFLKSLFVTFWPGGVGNEDSVIIHQERLNNHPNHVYPIYCLMCYLLLGGGRERGGGGGGRKSLVFWVFDH